MIKVYRIPVPKELLLKLPKQERVCLLQLGNMANQVLMFQKLLVFSTRLQPADEVEQHTTGVQTQMLVRLAASAMFEALLVVERSFVKNEIGKNYADKIDSEGNAALSRLKKLMGKSGLLANVRNNYGFHYPKMENIEDAFQSAVADPGFEKMWKVYFSDHGWNSMFLFCDLISVKGMAAKAGLPDLSDFQKELIAKLRQAAINLVEFTQSFFAAVWVEHFGNVINAEGITQIVGAPKFDEVPLPFFVDVEHMPN